MPRAALKTGPSVIERGVFVLAVPCRSEWLTCAQIVSISQGVTVVSHAGSYDQKEMLVGYLERC
jgi:hypothetical protein